MLDSMKGSSGAWLGTSGVAIAMAMASQGCFGSHDNGGQGDASFDGGVSADGFGSEAGDDASPPIDSGTHVDAGTDAAVDTGAPVEAGSDAAAPLAHAWTWVNGSNASGSMGNYGTLRAPAANNSPPAREATGSALGPSGTLWLFGGYSYVGSSAYSYLNDLWKYDMASGDWTWMAGASTTGTVGVYPSTVGTGGSASYFPGARSDASLWVDATGNVWLFGGTDGTNYFNDLWKFDGTYWTWVAGSSTTNVAGSYPATPGTGGSLTYFPGARRAAGSWIDGTGNLWLFGGTNASSSVNHYLADLWKFDGTYWTWMGGSSSINATGVYGNKGTAATTNAPGARMEPARGIDASGTFWMFGGYGVDGSGNQGYLNDLWTYAGGEWTWRSGATVSSSPTASAVYGVFPPTVRTSGPTYMPGGRSTAAGAVDGSGHFWVYGGWGYDGAGAQNYLGDLWMFDGTSWTWESGQNTANQAGVYGMRGTAALTNVPGTRWNPLGWSVGGKLWMFGGSGDDTTTTAGVMNDLWSYEP